MSTNAEPQATLPATQQFNVHLYAVMRMPIPNVTATSHAAAIETARVSPELDELLDRCQRGGVEFVDEFSHFVVDVVGDDEYHQSRWFYSQEDPLWLIAQDLVWWADGGRAPIKLETIVQAAREAVTASV